jgi:hypothetical protein
VDEGIKKGFQGGNFGEKVIQSVFISTIMIKLDNFVATVFIKVGFVNFGR